MTTAVRKCSFLIAARNEALRNTSEKRCAEDQVENYKIFTGRQEISPNGEFSCG